MGQFVSPMASDRTTTGYLAGSRSATEMRIGMRDGPVLCMCMVHRLQCLDCRLQSAVHTLALSVESDMLKDGGTK